MEESRKVRRRPTAARPMRDAAAHEEKVRVAAYYRAEHRGFAPGRELDDWVEAEAALTGDEPAPRRARSNGHAA